MKEKVYIIFVIIIGGWIFSGCTKDKILDNYNKVIQYAGSIELTNDISLQGTRKNGVDDYTGTYEANYEDFSKKEYLFGGTSIKREAGNDIAVVCTLKITSGTAKVFWISGDEDPTILIETDGTYSDTITLPNGGNYIGIECNDFTGSVELSIN